MEHFVHLSNRARIIVAADPDRHSHALRQLRRYLPGRTLEVVEPASLLALAENADLLVWLADSSASLPANLISVAEVTDLAEDAFLLRTGMRHGRPALLAIGGGRPGLIHAVNEVGLRHLVSRDDVLELPQLDVRHSPALPYRLLWTWDHSTNWYLEQVGLQEIGAMNYYAKPEEGFLEDYRRLVDFMSLHRIGGVTIYGFCAITLAALRRLKRCAAMPTSVGAHPAGVGINAYGGIYREGNHRYNLSTWLNQYPRTAPCASPVAFHIPDFPKLWFPETHYTDTACPSKPENARYHEEAIHWLAETFEILGGINFETGDYGVCTCP